MWVTVLIRMGESFFIWNNGLNSVNSETELFREVWHFIICIDHMTLWFWVRLFLVEWGESSVKLRKEMFDSKQEGGIKRRIC